MPKANAAMKGDTPLKSFSRMAWTMGIKAKLIFIFIFIKVLPLVALAWFAGHEIRQLGRSVEERTTAMTSDTRRVVGQIGSISVENSIRALDMRSREAIEHLTTLVADNVAAFLYDRDRDILSAAALDPDKTRYKAFLDSHNRGIIEPGPWGLDPKGEAWIPLDSGEQGPVSINTVPDNSKDFHSRPLQPGGTRRERPLYLEMTFVDPQGVEKIKVTTSSMMPARLQDVSERHNTWCKAEDYFEELRRLKPGEVYVSEVIGAYVGSRIIGAYTPAAALKAGIDYNPREAAYAGKENPVGRRFQGIIRWATPVLRQGTILGYVTLALDHAHLMEFTDHLMPTEERFTAIPDASAGNYAFMWDYKNRCIAHPRQYFITGYDPKTGDPEVPWLDDQIYRMWQQSGKSYAQFIPEAPEFLSPALDRKPALELTRQGLLGLDGRYLNFAPQCAGWKCLAENGGSGSFVIFWTGLWKLTTAAAIPYHTGRYGGPMGFGYVTIGASVDDFHRAATESAKEIDSLVSRFENDVAAQTESALEHIGATLRHNLKDLTLSTAVMVVLVILIAIWMANALTKRILAIVGGAQAFTNGDLSARLTVKGGDEIAQLSIALNAMCDTLVASINEAREAEANYRKIFENALEGIYRSTPEGRFVQVNPSMASLFGFDSPQAMVEGTEDIANTIYVSATSRATYLALLRKHGRVANFETEFRSIAGRRFWGRVMGVAICDEAGQMLYIEGLVLDITAEKEASIALQQAKEAAERASQLKTHFLSVVSHELRTPLTAVAGFVKVIQKKLTKNLFPKLDSSEVKTARDMRLVTTDLDIVIKEGERLTNLINDVLDLTKLESGRQEWQMVPVSPVEILDKVKAGATLLASQKGLDLVVDAAADLPMVMADSEKLLQVFFNLVYNAIKFADAGAIICSAVQVGMDIVFAVADEGPGIAVEHQDAIFNKFWQHGDLLTDRPKGTGLGLAICKEIITQHQGRIWVESELGQGSVFKFTIPIAGQDHV